MARQKPTAAVDSLGSVRTPGLGAQLLRIREHLGLTQREVARRTEGALHAAGLSRIESGDRYPSLRTLETLAAVYEMGVIIGPTRTFVVIDSTVLLDRPLSEGWNAGPHGPDDGPPSSWLRPRAKDYLERE